MGIWTGCNSTRQMDGTSHVRALVIALVWSKSGLILLTCWVCVKRHQAHLFKRKQQAFSLPFTCHLTLLFIYFYCLMYSTYTPLTQCCRHTEVLCCIFVNDLHLLKFLFLLTYLRLCFSSFCQLFSKRIAACSSASRLQMLCDPCTLWSAWSFESFLLLFLLVTGALTIVSLGT